MVIIMGWGKERIVNLARELVMGEITSNVSYHATVTMVENNVSRDTLF